MQKINLEIWDIINQERVSQEYNQGPQQFEKLVESLARSHKIPAHELNIRETITNSLVTNEQSLMTYSKHLAIDSPNPLYYSSRSMVESILVKQSQFQKKTMVDKECQCEQEEKLPEPPLKHNCSKCESQTNISIGTMSHSPLKLQISQEEMKSKLKSLIQEVKLQQFDLLMMGGEKPCTQQDEKIDQLRRRRINELKKFDKDIVSIENQITEANERLKEVKFTSEEQIEEIERILAQKTELEKNLEMKEKKRFELQATLNKPLSIKEVRDEFYKMKWKIFKKIGQIRKNLIEKNIFDEDFFDQLKQIEEQTQKLDNEMGQEILVNQFKQ